MKKLLIICILSLLYSCGSVLTSTKEITKNTISGNWKLSTITFDDNNSNQKEIFDVYSKNCLIDSSWKFKAGENEVSFSGQKQDCKKAIENYIYYTKQSKTKDNSYDLLIVPSSDKKSKGFRFKLEQVSNSFMQWQIIETKDKKETITYLNFIKM